MFSSLVQVNLIFEWGFCSFTEARRRQRTGAALHLHSFSRRDVWGSLLFNRKAWLVIEEACEHREAVCVNASVWETMYRHIPAVLFHKQPEAEKAQTLTSNIPTALLHKLYNAQSLLRLYFQNNVKQTSSQVKHQVKTQEHYFFCLVKLV